MPKARTAFFLAATLQVLVVLSLAPPALAAPAPELLSGLEMRTIGPASMRGRIAAVDAVVSDPDVIWVGAASGGVWKTRNAGLTWAPVFDDQPVHSIGALAIYQRSPDIVWVGTGEGNPRNSVSVGNGVYRTLDGGASWQHLGLEATEQIHRVIVHPEDPDVAWVCALGRIWGENADRGVYKTTDGGTTWRHVLFHDARSGCADLVADPTNPRKLMATLWDFQRRPWDFRSGGPGSGIWVSHDGGEAWTRRAAENGLPKGDLGRIGLAIAPSDPRVVYALVEAERSALLRSDDGGGSFVTVNDNPGIAPRPFYYADLQVDPERPDRVYNLWSLVTVSDDGGRHFKTSAGWPPVHPDQHAMWIDPNDGDRIILGNDGGLATSRDRGVTWRVATNLPLAQFYHVAVDDAVPYNVYGGLQDNGSWRGPADVWEWNGAIRNHHWQLLSFGDGFDTRPDRELAGVGYSMAQGGHLVRWENGGEVLIRPESADGERLRFNWNAGLALDPFDAATLYYGSQYVHRSRDRGRSWERISPDLTTDDAQRQQQDESGGLTRDVTAAENFTSILAIAPSPLEDGILWVGTDDGRLHVTRDGGQSWTSLEDRVPEVPSGTWIPHIVASPHDAGVAFVVFDDHRRGNREPYLVRVDGFGESLYRLETDGVDGYALSVLQDPVDPEVLYLGTELGLWISWSSGEGKDAWMRFSHGLPTTSVMDMAIQEREDDLVLGTHGRGVYILDDLEPLRRASDEVFAKSLHLFPIPDARQVRLGYPGSDLAGGHGEYIGASQPYGAMITYSLAGSEESPASPEGGRAESDRREDRNSEERSNGSEAEAEAATKVKIEILADGEIIRRLEGPTGAGIHRVAWNLRRDAFREPSAADWFVGAPEGPEIPPGEYVVVVRHADQEARAALQVTQDPRTHFSAVEIEARWATILEAGEMTDQAARAVEHIDRARADLDVLRARLALRARDLDLAPEVKADAELEEAIGALDTQLVELAATLRIPPDAQGIYPETDVLSRLRALRGRLEQTWETPTPTERLQIDQVRATFEAALEAHRELFAGDVAALAERVAAAGFGVLSFGDVGAKAVADVP